MIREVSRVCNFLAVRQETFASKSAISFHLPQNVFHTVCINAKLHSPSLFAVKAKIYDVLYKQSSSIAFDETSSYWSAPKNS